MAQRRQRADRRVQRGIAVDERGGGAERPADRRTGQAHQPAHGLTERIERRPVAVGTVLPEPRHRAQDDVGPQLAQPVVAEPHLFHDSGAKILQHDVGGRHQLGEDFLAALGAHVEAEAFLAPVVDREIDALAAHHRLRAPGLLAAEFLDLDDLGAEVRQDHAAARPGLIPRQFQDPDAVEGSTHPAASEKVNRAFASASILRPAWARGKESTMEYEFILAERRDGVALITLNRPDKLNALSFPLMSELDDALTEYEGDDSIGAVILTGAGDRAFSAGADIHEMAGLSSEELAKRAATRGEISWHIASYTKPIIGAINGLAYGGAALLSSSLDLRIGCEKTQFRFLAATYGRVNSTWSLPALVGTPKAKELLYTGRAIGV